MTESQFQAKLLRKLRSHLALKDAVIWKHTDARNGGIPDVSITVNGKTLWFELKVEPNKTSKLQEYYLQKLAPSAFVVLASHDGKNITVYGMQWTRSGDLNQAVSNIVFACINQ